MSMAQRMLESGTRLRPSAAGRQARRREARLCRRVRWPARRCSAARACARTGMESPRPALDALPARAARCQRRDARSK